MFGGFLCCFGSSVGWFVKDMVLLSNVALCIFYHIQRQWKLLAVLNQIGWSSKGLKGNLFPTSFRNICGWLEQNGSVNFDRWEGCGTNTHVTRHQRMSVPEEAVLYSPGTCNTWLAAHSLMLCKLRLHYFQCYRKRMLILLRLHICCHKNASPAVHPSPIFPVPPQSLWQHQYAHCGAAKWLLCLNLDLVSL